MTDPTRVTTVVSELKATSSLVQINLIAWLLKVAAEDASGSRRSSPQCTGA